MCNLSTLKPRTLGPLNLGNTVNLLTDQHRNTANTSSLGKDRLSRSKRSSVWVVGNSTIRTTTPKVGKAAQTAFPAGQYYWDKGFNIRRLFPRMTKASTRRRSDV